MIVCSQARWRGSCVGLDQLRPCLLWSAAAEGATGQLLAVQERGAHDIVRMEFWRVPGHLAVHRQTSELHYVSADGWRRVGSVASDQVAPPLACVTGGVYNGLLGGGRGC